MREHRQGLPYRTAKAADHAGGENHPGRVQVGLQDERQYYRRQHQRCIASHRTAPIARCLSDPHPSEHRLRPYACRCGVVVVLLPSHTATRRAPISLATPLCAGKNVMVPTAAFQNVNHAEKFFEGKIDRSVDRNANTWVRFGTTSKSKKAKKDEHWWSTYQVPHPPQPPILCPALPCSSHASHASHASHTYKWPSRHAPDWPFTVHMPGALSGLEGALSALGPAALPCPSVTGAAPTRTPQPRLSRIASPGGQVA